MYVFNSYTLSLKILFKDMDESSRSFRLFWDTSWASVDWTVWWHFWYCLQPLESHLWYHTHNCTQGVTHFSFIMICASQTPQLPFLNWHLEFIYSLVWRQEVALRHLKPLCEHPTDLHRGSHCRKSSGFDRLWATGKGRINYKFFPCALLTSKLWGWRWGDQEPSASAIVSPLKQGRSAGWACS